MNCLTNWLNEDALLWIILIATVILLFCFN